MNVELVARKGPMELRPMAGLGWASTGWVGALLAIVGLLIFAVSVAEQDRSGRSNGLARSDASA